MDEINVIDPQTGQAHAIPYDQLPGALEAGGQFADEEQKQKAIRLQQGGQTEPAETADVAEEPEEEQSSFKSVGADAMRMLSRTLRKGVGYLEKIPEEVRGIK